MDVAVHFSSKTDQWATPQALFDKLNAEFGPCMLDVCADASNTKCTEYIPPENDSLRFDWAALVRFYGHPCGAAWMNPPYGRGIGAWVEKAATAGVRVICLLPARTDTRWFQTYCLPVLEGKRPGVVRFLPGRVKFGNAKAGAPFPSVVVVFDPPKEEAR